MMPGMDGMMPGMMPGMMGGGMMPMGGMMMMPNGMGMMMPTGGMMPGMMMPGMAPLPPPRTTIEPPAVPSGAPPEPKLAPMDPDVQNFCDKLGIEQECCLKLNEVMRKRADTKESDLAQLADILDDVGDPTSLLEFKIEEMESGEFVGKVLEDRQAMALGLNYGLNKEAIQKLYELTSFRSTKKGEDIVRMERLLEFAKDPSATAIRFAGQVLRGELDGLPDLSEAQDVIKKFDLDREAKDKLIEIVLARTEDSSAVLGGLEVYFERVRDPSATLVSLSSRLISGGPVPDPDELPRNKRNDQRDRERSPKRAASPRQMRTRRSPSIGKKKKSRSRSRRRSSSRGRRKK